MTIPFDNHEYRICDIFLANEDSAEEAVELAGDTFVRAAGEGWSAWVWVRLANGDLILGTFPEGDTYMRHEVAVDDDYSNAEQARNLRSTFATAEDLAIEEAS